MVAIVSYAFGTVEKVVPKKAFKGFSEVWVGDQFDWAWTSGHDCLERASYRRSDMGLYSLCGELSDFDKYKLRKMLNVEGEIKFFGGEEESAVNALDYAIIGIESGKYKSALVGASELSLEKCMCEKPYEKNLLRKAGEWPIQQIAQIKLQAMKDLGIEERQFAGVPVKDHFHGSLNPAAQYSDRESNKKITADRVLKSPYVEGCGPLRVLEKCFDNSGGSISIILTNDEEAKKHKKPVYFEGFGKSNKRGDEEKLYDIPSMRFAVEKACAGKISIDELNLLQIPDLGTPLEIIGLVNIGLIRSGEAKEILSKTFEKANEPAEHEKPWAYEIGRKVFVNTDGGDKAGGRPGPSTSFLRKTVETYQQVSGTAGERQIENPKFGVTVQTTDWRNPEFAAYLWGSR